LTAFLRAALCSVAFVALVAVCSAANDPNDAANSSIARGAIAYVFFCADCHGANGQGDQTKGVPQLAGMPAADLAQRLAQLSTAPADRSAHVSLLGKLDRKDIQAVADYLATLAAPPAVATR
jgi:cytochrome c553